MQELVLAPDETIAYEHTPPADGRPTYVFVNALTGNTGHWTAVITPRLHAAGIGTLVYDFRGQPASKTRDDTPLDAASIVDDLVALLDHTKPARAVLCGLSIGGLFAAQAALRGAACDGLVLLNTLRQPGMRLNWINTSTRNVARFGGPALLMDMMAPVLVGPWLLEKLAAEKPAEPAYAPLPPESGTMRLLAGSLSADWTVPYERLTMPTLVITGHKDRVFREPEVVDALFARLPDGTREEWPDIGHLVPLEAPERLADSLVRFADRIPAA